MKVEIDFGIVFGCEGCVELSGCWVVFGVYLLVVVIQVYFCVVDFCGSYVELYEVV